MMRACGDAHRGVKPYEAAAASGEAVNGSECVEKGLCSWLHPDSDKVFPKNENHETTALMPFR